MRALVLALLLPLAAAAADIADLPSAEQARAAIESHPTVLAAQAAVAAAAARRHALEAGPYETQMRIGAGQRRDRVLDQNLSEYELGVERAFRIGAKSDIDQAIGEQSVAQAKLGVGEAMHESARSLLRLWFVWMRTAAQAEVWDAQTSISGRQLGAVDKRVRLGDAPRQEKLLAESALAQATTSRLQARMRVEVARAELTRNFPAIAPPATVPIAEAPPPCARLRVVARAGAGAQPPSRWRAPECWTPLRATWPRAPMPMAHPIPAPSGLRCSFPRSVTMPSASWAWCQAFPFYAGGRAPCRGRRGTGAVGRRRTARGRATATARGGGGGTVRQCVRCARRRAKRGARRRGPDAQQRSCGTRLRAGRSHPRRQFSRSPNVTRSRRGSRRRWRAWTRPSRATA